MKKILALILTMSAFGIHAHAIASYAISNQLIKGIQKEQVRMDYSRSYMGKIMDYQCVPMRSIMLKLGVKKNAIVELIAKDNFSVYVPANLFFESSKSKSIPYLAIEPTQDRGWPRLKNGTSSSAGPYQIIWTNPSYSHISDEYWAWSVTNITIHKTYPQDKLMPLPKTNNQNIKLGHKIYISHCASCHAINKFGNAVIGPNLGNPHNPLDYYPKHSDLKAFIRNPNKFRPGRMSGSSKAGMNNKELNALISYFEFIK